MANDVQAFSLELEDQLPKNSLAMGKEAAEEFKKKKDIAAMRGYRIVSGS